MIRGSASGRGQERAVRGAPRNRSAVDRAWLRAGGAWLLLLGDPVYYAIAGVALIASSVLLSRRHIAGVVIYVALVAATIPWPLPRDAWERQRASGRFPESEFAAMDETPFGLRREVLLPPLGIPCTPPPWGRLVAIDLK